MSRLLQRLTSLKPVMAEIGELAVESIAQTFEDEGRPRPWIPLAPSTIERRAKQGHVTTSKEYLYRQSRRTGKMVRAGTRKVVTDVKILQVHGFLKTMTTKVENDSVTIAPRAEAWPYAAIQHFGGMAGRGHRTRIPARPFLMLQDEDWIRILAVTRRWLELVD